MLSTEARKDLIRRMRKIEGQAQGIQRMLADDRDCREVLDQLASVRAATQSASIALMKHYALACLHDPAQAESPEKALGNVIELLVRISD